jgi:branched-subunit amino acid aminotransferase/4-amino-4-deoxychorismate lyase
VEGRERVKIWVNGTLRDEAAAVVSVLDHGLTVGDGVFETVLVTAGTPFALTRHLRRLARSASALELPEVDVERVRVAVDETLAANDAHPRARLRITYTAGIAPFGSARGGSARDGSARDGSPHDGSARGGSARDGSARDGSPHDGSARVGSANDGPARDGSAHDGSASDGSANDGSARVGSARDDSARDGSARYGSEPTLVVGVQPLPPAVVASVAITVPFRRNERGALAGVKTTSYAENVLALARAREAGATEALFADTTGRLSEGTGSNVFVVVDGRLLTPSLNSGCLAGVTRGLVLEWFPAAAEADLPFDVLARAEEILLTSTLRDVQAVHTLDGRSLPAPGPVTRQVQEIFAARAAAESDPS